METSRFAEYFPAGQSTQLLLSSGVCFLFMRPGSQPAQEISPVVSAVLHG
jgi:hypothetical protein